MIPSDLFVSIVAITLALFLIGSSILQWEIIYTMRMTKMVERNWGRSSARIVIFLLGLVLLSVASYLLLQ